MFALRVALAVIVLASLALPAQAASAVSVDTLPVTKVSTRSAELPAYVHLDESFDKIELRVEYGRSIAYGKHVTQEYFPSRNFSYSGHAVDLEGDTLYHYRAVVLRDGVPVARGADLTFRTRSVGLPAFGWGGGHGGADGTAQLYGEIFANGPATSGRFEWGLTTAYGNRTESRPLLDDHRGDFLDEYLEGLPAQTLFHTRVVAERGGATVAKGPDKLFVTGPFPTVRSLEFGSVTATSARLAGSVNPNGMPTRAYVQLRDSRGRVVGHADSRWIGAGVKPVPVKFEVEGLSPQTTYLASLTTAYGQTAVETAYGYNYTFRTSRRPPGVVTLRPDEVGRDAATLRALIDPLGRAASLRFEYGRTRRYGASTGTVPVAAGFGPLPFGVRLDRLAPGTTYHLRAVAVVGGKVAATGADKTLRTRPAPRPVLPRGAVRRMSKRGRVAYGFKAFPRARGTATLRLGGRRTRPLRWTASPRGRVVVSFALSRAQAGLVRRQGRVRATVRAVTGRAGRKGTVNITAP